MSKYQELSKTFAASVQLQVAEYLAWPRDQMAFASDERAQTEEPICTNSSVRLHDDGNIHFWALFTVIRLDNENHRSQLIFPFKVKKLEDSFFADHSWSC